MWWESSSISTWYKNCRAPVNVVHRTFELPPSDFSNCQSFQSSLALDVWTTELDDDPDKDFLLQGIAEGFRLTDEHSVFQPAFQNNYTSATGRTNRIQVESQIQYELSLIGFYGWWGFWLTWPFSPCPSSSSILLTCLKGGYLLGRFCVLMFCVSIAFIIACLSFFILFLVVSPSSRTRPSLASLPPSLGRSPCICLLCVYVC